MPNRDRFDIPGQHAGTGAATLSRETRLPDFLIIGAAKSGTTSLYAALAQHPQIFMSTPKEPEFFSKDSEFARGIDHYASLFRGVRGDQVCGEGSTTYTRWPHTGDAASRIAMHLPNVKMIYIMRHPVHRAYSHYAHHMRLEVTMTFEQALERSSEYLDCGLYMNQIRRYLRHFPRERFLFLFLEDFRDDPAYALAKIQFFLGVDYQDLDGAARIQNESGPDYFIRRKTTWKLREWPLVSAIADRIPEVVRAGAYQLLKASPLGKNLQRQYVLPRMLPETRRQLLDFYREPNRELAEFLGRDLSRWNE